MLLYYGCENPHGHHNSIAHICSSLTIKSILKPRLAQVAVSKPWSHVDDVYTSALLLHHSFVPSLMHTLLLVSRTVPMSLYTVGHCTDRHGPARLPGGASG